MQRLQEGEVKQIFYARVSGSWWWIMGSILNTFCLYCFFVGKFLENGNFVIKKSLSYVILLMVPKHMWYWHCCSYCICMVLFFYGFCSSIYFSLTFVFFFSKCFMACWKFVNLVCFFLMVKMTIFQFLLEMFSCWWRFNFGVYGRLRQRQWAWWLMIIKSCPWGALSNIFHCSGYWKSFTT